METPHTNLVARLRAYQRSLDARELGWRRRQLEALRALIKEEESAILDALKADLRRNRVESCITETDLVVEEIDHALAHLATWAAPRRVPTPVFLQPGASEVVWEPLGVALIIGAWNYPIQLTLAPLVPCIAAGNAAVIKPSELAPITAVALGELLPRYLDPKAFVVVRGGAAEAEALLTARFDRVFFTGSARVGRMVMAAAARHLTPVTLELGGKSPCIVDASARVSVAARRIAFGKFSNAGQTCVAPDYVLAHQAIADDLVDGIAEALHEFYGPEPRDSDCYGRILNSQHHDRLVAMLGDGDPVIGGGHEATDLYMAPTVLRDVHPGSPVMQDEIFGPILPVLDVRDANEAVEFVSQRSKPLALYVFAEDKAVVDDVVRTTRAGGVCINDTLAHIATPELPFGGVGDSGMGKYHGEWGFREFSNAKAVLDRGTWLDPGLHYPPHTGVKAGLLRTVRG